MEVTSAENAKVSDSAYSNSCSNSQSQRSSGSSKSRRSNSSGSSGYCGGPSSTLASSNAALPQTISKRKDKENKKKKSKPMIVGPAESETPVCAAESPLQEAATPVGSFPDVLPQPESEKTVEVADIELVDDTDPGEHNSISDDTFDSTSTPCSIDDTNSQSNKGFCAVISMYDGVILHITSSLSAALGFPKDTWIGRSFIEFVHPKDRDTFTRQIANGIVAPHADNSKRLNGQRTSLFCGLRKYRGAKFNKPSMNEQVKMKKPVRYLPVHLTLTCRDFHEDNSIQDPKAMFLLVTVQPVLSAYQAPEETIISSKFTTRHTATCHFSHCDFEVVQYFGYLPQDMIGRSLFEFYHPEDLPFIKEIYETVVKLRGTSFRSKPYRFAVQNGGYVLLETEWSSFVNPWSRKLESVIGHHRVLRGPSDPDIFQPSDKILANISDEVLKESKIIQDEIHVLLNEVIPSPIEVPEQCTGLVSFVENLLVEAEALESKNDIVADSESFSEHDSVMLGQSSVHHENFDSKSSTETPLSYNRLNYIENIQRYFQSEPITTNIYESDEKNVNVPSSANDEDMGPKTKRPTLMDPTRKCMSQFNSSEASSSKSAGNSSSGSNNKTSFTSRGETCFTISNTTETASSKLSTLTMVVLSKHNEDMEKQLVQRHRQIRSSIKSDKLKDSQSKSTTEQSTDVFVHTSKTPALKRTGSPIEKGDGIKVSKRKNISTVITPEPVALNPTISNASAGHSSTGIQNSPNIIGWLSQPIGVPSMLTSQPYTPAQNVSQQISTSYPAITQMIPIFYFPTPQNTFGPIYFPQEHPGPPQNMQSAPQSSPYIQYLTPSMAIYPPVYGTPTPTAMMYGPMYRIPQLAVDKSEMSSDHNRLASQAASAKAEPGNIRTMSECSKRVLSLGELCSPCVSADEDCHGEENGPPAKNAKQNRPTEYNEDETSCSSLYSSFLNKSSDSSCNPDQKGARERLVGVPWKVGDTLNSNTERRALRKPPPWLEGVVMTPELIYQYQMDSKTLQEVLEADQNALKNLTQPLLVNDQLNQLYLDLELDGFGTKLMLDEEFSSNENASATSTDEGPDISSKHKQKWYSTMDYGQLVMIHEENAPFPPPQSLVTIGSSH